MSDTVLSERVAEAMKRGFSDLVREAMEHPLEEEGVEWVTRLYEELGQRLMSLTPRREDLHRLIHEAMDLSLFRQMLIHDAIDRADVIGLVSFVMGHLLRLCAPSQDALLVKVRDDLVSMAERGEPSSSVFPLLLVEVHSACDEIDNLSRPILERLARP